VQNPAMFRRWPRTARRVVLIVVSLIIVVPAAGALY